MAPNSNDPASFQDVNALPDDAVALLVWREDFGGQPLTIIITRGSWEMNKKVVMDAGMTFGDRIYEFESPVNEQGRKTIFHLEKVIGWCANFHTGIMQIAKPKLVVPA